MSEAAKLARMYSHVASIYESIAEMEGMKAENAQREACGHSMAYTYENFSYVQAQLMTTRVQLEAFAAKDGA